MMLEAPNNKLSRSVKLEYHYTVVGEPGEYYLTHFTPENDKVEQLLMNYSNI